MAAQGDVADYFKYVIAEVSHKWDDLARELGFNWDEIKGIEGLTLYNDKRCREVLERWKNRDGSYATLEVLKQALINIGQRRVAENLEGSPPVPDDYSGGDTSPPPGMYN